MTVVKAARTNQRSFVWVTSDLRTRLISFRTSMHKKTRDTQEQEKEYILSV